MSQAKKPAQTAAPSSPSRSRIENILIGFATAISRGVVPAALLGLAAFCTVAFLSFDQNDPSGNTASDSETIGNIAGTYGAIFADKGLQFFGMGVYILPFIICLWAIARMRAKLPVFRELRASSLFLTSITIIIATLSSMIVASSLTAYFYPETLNAGMVGVRVQGLFHDYLGAEWILLAMSLLAIFGIFTLFSAARLSLKDYGLAAYNVGYAVKVLLWKTGIALHYGAVMLWTFIRWVHTSRPRTKKAAPRPKAFVTPDISQEPEPERPVTKPLARITPSLGEAAVNVQAQPIQQPQTQQPQVQQPQPTPAATAAPSARHGNSHEGFQLPTLDLLKDPLPPVVDATVSHEKLQNNARRLEEVLGDFNISGVIQRIKPGPVVTMYELEPAPGIKTSKIVNLADDIARNMRALSVRIATIAGHSELGVELPNEHREMVNMKELLAGDAYQKHPAKLPMILGKMIDGTPLIVDLATMPHLLIAGTTGSGKSVGLNVMLLSILYRLNPDQCRVIMIDPKMLEFSVYDGIPHLLTPVVTEPKQAVVALKWTVREMENRYRLMSRVGVRNIDGYNARVEEALSKGEILSRKVQTGVKAETGEPIFDIEELATEPFPLIVVVVDEMADLMIVAGKDIEASIQRLAQMARAAGIHLIMATQRPSVDVITGTIKANFPTRISYRVTSKIDSRTIIGEQGAEQLLGKGDLLLMEAAGNLKRVHAPFVQDDEVEGICNWLRAQRPPNYLEEVTDEGAVNAELGDAAAAMFDANEDPDASLYDQAVAIVAKHQKASTSFVQRQLRIGYNRAADLIDEMEQQGVISAAGHANKREVLIKSFEE